MLPSQFADLSAFPRVARFVRQHFDMQFDDVRSMMKLPRPKQGMTGGCNFASAVALCNLIAGVATVLYERPRGYPGRGDGFVALLMQYYPWQPDEDGQRNAEVLWEFVRNPLVHSLGVGVTPGQRQAQVTIVKSSYRERGLRRIERSSSHPGPSLAIATRGNHHTLWVVGLYWGVSEILRRLLRDPAQMAAAERRLKKRGWQRGA